MIPTTLDQLNDIRNNCRSMVNKRSSLSAAAAIIPLPGVDISADIAIMSELLTTINREFGLDAEQISQLDPERRQILLVLITSMGSEVIGKTVTATMVRNLLKRASSKIVTKQATKFMPLIGQAISATISFGAMKYLGNSHIDHCYQVALQYMHHVDTRWTDDVIDI